MSMQGISNIVLLLWVTRFATVTSVCSFPVQWRAAGTSWFVNYHPFNGAIRAYTFVDDDITLTEDEGGFVAANYKCIDSNVTDSYVYYVRKIDQSFVCVQSAPAGEIMLERTQDVAATEVDSAAICPSAMTSTSATWLIRLPFYGHPGVFDVFPARSYQVTYTESPGDIKCTGDNTSVITLEGNTLKVNTCFAEKTISYKQPLRMNLMVMARTSGKILDSEDNGDILLLGNLTTDRFYCARYKIDVTTVQLSIDISDEYTANCKKAQTFTSSEPDKFIAFTLKCN